jgi:uncharacterized protein involved in response to NO
VEPEYRYVSTAFSPLEWHVHELVYGFVPSIIAGFLLTATQTGRAVCRSLAGGLLATTIRESGGEGRCVS